MLQLKLSEAELHQLNYERYHYPCPLVQKRIHAVYLKSILSLSNEIVGLHRDSVSDWVHIYEQEGFKAICRLGYGNNKSGLESEADNILASFHACPPLSINEAKSRIEAMTGISRSPSQVSAFMKRHGLPYIKTGHIPAKADAQKQRQWVETTLNPAIKKAQNGDCHLLFMDAAHFVLQPFVCALWCLKRVFIKAAAGRNRINVLGAVNAITKQVTFCSNTTFINAQTIVTFLQQLKEQYASLPLKIVLDNARYQHCKLVEETAQKLGITLLFLPAYSPNLNIIERLWNRVAGRFTKKTILYAKYYESPQKFHAAVTGFFEVINQQHNAQLKNLLTLNFQFFDNENAESYPT